jgi:hypothetical protein
MDFCPKPFVFGQKNHKLLFRNNVLADQTCLIFWTIVRGQETFVRRLRVITTKSRNILRGVLLVKTMSSISLDKIPSSAPGFSHQRHQYVQGLCIERMLHIVSCCCRKIENASWRWELYILNMKHLQDSFRTRKTRVLSGLLKFNHIHL